VFHGVGHVAQDERGRVADLSFELAGQLPLGEVDRRVEPARRPVGLLPAPDLERSPARAVGPGLLFQAVAGPAYFGEQGDLVAGPIRGNAAALACPEPDQRVEQAR
jgi:hypothetical protein